LFSRFKAFNERRESGSRVDRIPTARPQKTVNDKQDNKDEFRGMGATRHEGRIRNLEQRYNHHTNRTKQKCKAASKLMQILPLYSCPTRFLTIILTAIVRRASTSSVQHTSSVSFYQPIHTAFHCQTRNVTACVCNSPDIFGPPVSCLQRSNPHYRH